jgi:hypothetical protein
MMPLPATESPDRPFDPQKRQTHDKKTDDVGYDESSSTILNSLNRKSEKITQPNRIPSHGKDQSCTASPGFGYFSHRC